jgi:hypothetical protein
MTGFSFPEDFPLEELVTQELISVSIGRHHLRLAFAREDGASIDIEAGFQLDDGSGLVVVAENSDLATGGKNLVDLLGKKIVAVSRQPNNILRLGFSNNAVLCLEVDSRGFESYHLYVAGQSVDVAKEW